MTKRKDERFDVSGLRSEAAKGVQRKIAVEGTPEQQRIIRSVIANSFTIKEQKALVSKGGLLFRIGDLGGDVAAQYWGKRNGDVYIIEIDPKFVDDGGTYLHEIVHHSRMGDDTRDSVLLRTRSKRNDIIFLPTEDDRSLEEAATILETLARETPYKDPIVPSYHCGPAGNDKKKAFEHIKEDRESVAGSAEPGSKGLRGLRAKKMVEKMFGRSHISDLRLDRQTAKERLEELCRREGNVIY